MKQWKFSVGLVYDNQYLDIFGYKLKDCAENEYFKKKSVTQL